MRYLEGWPSTLLCSLILLATSLVATESAAQPSAEPSRTLDLGRVGPARGVEVSIATSRAASELDEACTGWVGEQPTLSFVSSMSEDSTEPHVWIWVESPADVVLVARSGTELACRHTNLMPLPVSTGVPVEVWIGSPEQLEGTREAIVSVLDDPRDLLHTETPRNGNLSLTFGTPVSVPPVRATPEVPFEWTGPNWCAGYWTTLGPLYTFEVPDGGAWLSILSESPAETPPTEVGRFMVVGRDDPYTARSEALARCTEAVSDEGVERRYHYPAGTYALYPELYDSRDEARTFAATITTHGTFIPDLGAEGVGRDIVLLGEGGGGEDAWNGHVSVTIGTGPASVFGDDCTGSLSTEPVLRLFVVTRGLAYIDVQLGDEPSDSGSSAVLWGPDGPAYCDHDVGGSRHVQTILYEGIYGLWLTGEDEGASIDADVDFSVQYTWEE